ncbi:DUF4148 domain-containing protein [Pararobbsia alpina]|nr:DUF4148 domain-containing protein [Pararobbsia alpina]
MIHFLLPPGLFVPLNSNEFFLPFIEVYIMKISAIVLAVGLLSTSAAFAQNAPSSDVSGDAGVTALAQADTPSYDGTMAPKTRAEVRQELVKAQNDGELAYLKKTVYAHH